MPSRATRSKFGVCTHFVPYAPAWQPQSSARAKRIFGGVGLAARRTQSGRKRSRARRGFIGEEGWLSLFSDPFVAEELCLKIEGSAYIVRGVVCGVGGLSAWW